MALGNKSFFGSKTVYVLNGLGTFKLCRRSNPRLPKFPESYADPLYTDSFSGLLGVCGPACPPSFLSNNIKVMKKGDPVYFFFGDFASAGTQIN